MQLYKYQESISAENTKVIIDKRNMKCNCMLTDLIWTHLIEFYSKSTEQKQILLEIHQIFSTINITKLLEAI